MLKSIALAVCVALAIPVPEGPEPVELFSGEAWYTGQQGKEQDFTGILTRFDAGGRAGFGRFNPYRLLLEGDRKEMREVYVGGKPELLAAHVGKKVKLTGKAVDMEVEGRQHREIWPARLLVLDAEAGPKAKRLAILSEHRLYKMEPGQERVLEGVLRKNEMGGYILEMQANKAFGKEDLVLYPDAGDPLAPFVGRRVRIGGKQVIGVVGQRAFQHLLPAWIEVTDASGPDPVAIRRQVEALRALIDTEQKRVQQLQEQLSQPISDPEMAIRLKRQFGESLQVLAELKKKVADLEALSVQTSIPGVESGPLEEMKARLVAARETVDRRAAEVLEIQQKIAASKGQVPADKLRLLETVVAEAQARLAAERARLAVLEVEYARMMRLPPELRK